MSELVFTVFPSEVGWFALIGDGGSLRRLTFAHDSGTAAWKKIAVAEATEAGRRHWLQSLSRRLAAFAKGKADDFLDVHLDFPRQTDFQHRVTEACRRIGWGESLSYGELGEQAGVRNGARAVGNVMASNPLPIVVPCHRVLAAGGRLGGYSMGDEGLALKRRLLALEGHPRFADRPLAGVR